MARRVILEAGRTFGEFSLLPAFTPKGLRIENVSLETKLAENINLRVPFLNAAMRSVVNYQQDETGKPTGYETIIALGKEGGLGVIPARIPLEDQEKIAQLVKNYEAGFVEEPLTARSMTGSGESAKPTTARQLSEMYKQHGHSQIPIVDRNNYFLGIFDIAHFHSKKIDWNEPATNAMIKFEENNLPYVINEKLTVKEAQVELENKGSNYLIVLDEHKRLVKLAFKKDSETIPYAAAITSYPEWKEHVEMHTKLGCGTFIIDTSDGHNAYVTDVIKQFKEMKTGLPICAGNVVTYEGAKSLMNAGADIVKTGMSSGSICTTQREKALGRAPMTSLIEACRARDEYEKESGRYIPLIADGGITGEADRVIALTHADALMMGGYFNQFFEAAGDKLDAKGKITRIERDIVFVESYGEGSTKAKNLSRYGHASEVTFFAEGEVISVSYKGRLKPNVKGSIARLKAACVNAGCHDLDEFRKESVIELNSGHSDYILRSAHGAK